MKLRILAIAAFVLMPAAFMPITASMPATAFMPAPAHADKPLRPLHTYSIVARDSVTGQIGVAVQTHWFNVGSRVVWAEPGVGAVATQSLTDPAYGPLGLELMRAGKTAHQALAGLVAADPGEAVRQVAMIDASGSAATHTGARCIAEAGHHTGAQYSVQANLMENDTVWNAMARAYENTDGDLAARMLAALDAAQAEGGDIRGKQSAAIRIVTGERTGAEWRGVVMDLRVEDHSEPLVELRRLVDVSRAYDFMNEGDDRLGEGDTKGALEAYGTASQLLPDNPEIKFWAAITMMQSGEENAAMAYFREVFKADPKWKEVVRRLPASGLLDPSLVEPILSADR